MRRGAHTRQRALQARKRDGSPWLNPRPLTAHEQRIADLLWQLLRDGEVTVDGKKLALVRI